MKIKRILEYFEGIILAEYVDNSTRYLEKLCTLDRETDELIFLRWKINKREINQ